MAQDFYSILGVAKDADEKAIKSAFRKKSMGCHPDTGLPAWKDQLRASGKYATDAELETAFSQSQKGPEFKAFIEQREARFKELSGAHDVLSDATKRAHYDRVGHSVFTNSGGASRARPNPRGSASGFQDPNDMWNDIFRKARQTGGQRGTRGGGFNYTGPADAEREEIVKILKEARGAKTASGGSVRPNFSNTRWIFGDFSKLDLSGAIFSNRGNPQFITNYNFEGANLNKAVFDGATFMDIGRSSLANAKSIDGARFVGAHVFDELRLPHGAKNLNFSNAEFTHSARINQRLENCIFEGAEFRGSFGPNAELVGCKLGGFDISGVAKHELPRFTNCEMDGMIVHTSHLDHIRAQSPKNATIKVKRYSFDSHFSEMKFDEHGAEIKASGFSKAEESVRKFTSRFTNSDSALEHTPKNRTALMIGGAALLVGGVVAAVSIAENQEAKERKHTKRFPMPYPTQDWKTRTQQPQHASAGPSILQ